jgi:hypothetical protein
VNKVTHEFSVNMADVERCKGFPEFVYFLGMTMTKAVESTKCRC